MRVLAVVVALVGCGPASDPPLQTSCDGDFSVYTPGMRIATDEGGFEIELVQATPDPPDEGVNDWRIRLHPLGDRDPGAAVLVEPYMPAHDHGVSPPTYPSGPEGDVAPFDLIMPGVWEFRFTVDDGDRTERAAVEFCVEG